MIEKKVWKRLEEVLDPEMYISIVDLGLVYKVEEKEGTVVITMTLTTLGCPLFGSIEQDIVTRVKRIRGVHKVSVKLTFDPPWNMSLMSEKGKAILGI